VHYLVLEDYIGTLSCSEIYFRNAAVCLELTP
jgi:hypothetical protein